MNTETTTKHNSVFENKEQYLAFRAKWRQLYADGFHKPVRHDYRHGPYGYNSNREWTDGGPGFHMESPLTFQHHLIFNLALGRDPSKAFLKMRDRWEFWYKVCAVYSKMSGDKVFEPFGDTLTDDQKAEIRKRADAYGRAL